jgi:hypothetical protein
MISVGNVTNALVKNLVSGTTYFFAAKSRNDAGDLSDFSNEASFTGYNIVPNDSIKLETMPADLKNDQVVFSLGSDAPAGASINSTNGIVSWNAGINDANTIKNLTVVITDLTNPDASTQATFMLAISDFLDLTLDSVPVQTSHSASLPITLISSDNATNLTFTMNWPGDRLLNPSLTFKAPVVGGNLINQGTNLIIQLWTDGEDLTGTNQIAQINFQAAADQTSAFLNLKITAVAAVKTDASNFENVLAEPGEVVVVGTNPLLRPHVDQNQSRTLTLYANPGSNYQLQYTTGLSSPNGWQALQDYHPDNVQQTINLDSVNPVAFYRLMQN